MLKILIISSYKKIILKILSFIGVTKKTLVITLNRVKINSDQQKLLADMRADNLRSESPFKASKMWIDLGRKFDEWFWCDGVEEIETHAINSFFSSPTQIKDKKVFYYSCYMYYSLLKRRDKYNLLTAIPVNIQIESGLCFNFFNDMITWDKLISIDTIYSIEEVVPNLLTDRLVVLDLGAGWGRIGYFLKKANPSITYVIADLPEGLFVSHNYLPRVLPNEKIKTYNEIKGKKITKDDLMEGGIFFMGSQDIKNIEDKSIDILINIASFQEMTLTQVREYFDIIDKKVCGIFFTQQLKDGKTHGHRYNEISGFDNYPFLSKWETIYLRDSTFSNQYFEIALKIK